MTHNDITPVRLDALQARLALRVAAALTEQAEQVSPDISERLRHAREQALARARAVAKPAPAVTPTRNGGGTLSLGGPDDNTLWNKLGMLLPLLALVAGLLLIQQGHDRKSLAATADLDLALLSDDLPPDAYGDPGFLEFLKNPRD